MKLRRLGSELPPASRTFVYCAHVFSVGGTKGAKLAVPGLVDLSDFAAGTEGVARIVLDSVQDLLLKLALQMARDDYETRRERQRQGDQLAKAAGKYTGRAADTNANQRIVALRAAGHTIHKTATLSACSPSQVKRIWAIHLANQPKHAE